MPRSFAALKQRLARRPDSEHGQALVRLIIACVILAYLWGLQRFGAEGVDVGPMVLVMLVEAIIGLGLMTAIVVNPGVSHARRWIGMLADYTTLATLMSLNADALAPLYVIIMWVTVGNGLRFGTAYLYSAMALSSTAFLAVILANPYWRQQPYLAIGLWIGLIAIPGYLSSLLKNLQRVTEEARRANAAKTRFLANMSHEFRSPLNGIIGMAELMRGTKLGAEQREYAEVIHTSAQTLLLLVDDVLDISAIETGKLQRKDADFNLGDQIQRLQKMLQPHAAGKGLALKVGLDKDVPLLLHGDGAHLTQILLNLMHNAIKFTEHGEVSLAVKSKAVEGGQATLLFSVRDTGIGIPEEAKERIFGAFEQVDSGPTRRFGGTGLGTTIAKTLVHLLEGEIGLEDNPGGGSHFWVQVPMQVRRTGGGRKPEEGSGNIVAFDDPFIRHKARVRPLRILIADDQHANRTVVTRILERAGHRVQAANDGEQALDMIEVGNVDLAVIDMHMPQLSGLDVIRQLRFMQAGGKRTPIIVLSADATPQASRDAEDAGAQAFLTKPVVVGRLLETIADVMTPARTPGVRPVGESTRPVTNPAVLKELAEMGLGEAFLRDFVEQCLKDASGCLVELGQTGTARRWSDFREVAHALKGVAENLGAQSVAERCSHAMRASDDTLARDHQRLVGELTQQMTAVSQQSREEVIRLTQARPDGPGAIPGPDAS
ncbi:two-component system sensor histidine kinase RpfC [Luteimonas cucumeris]|uniref:Sensory/regulatory protein RpfC n=1 Tax=Luteimonas cucumeris TaxID=985012 RepID=A0A562L845_9GAMM|nr:ATP-binding protein [Luteimonas cucumeris]TWI03803.1 two-component system sensor histidine kinase RpfC [Luteimonas cucumeris]